MRVKREEGRGEEGLTRARRQGVRVRRGRGRYEESEAAVIRVRQE